MGDSADIPGGPSGRIPEAGIRLVSGLGNSTILTLFRDGAFGIWRENKSAKTYDGSEYEMITHSYDEIGKIEDEETESKLSMLVLGISIIFAFAYLALVIYIRSNSNWPGWFSELTGGNQVYFMIAIPALIWIFQKRVLKITGGEISVFPKNSDPYRFPVQSQNIDTVSDVCGFLFILTIGTLFYIDGPSLFFDLIILLITVFLVANRIMGRPNYISSSIKKSDSLTPVYEIKGFMKQIERITRDITKKTRLENPLLELLMANESQVLEFKGSLWASYHGVTGRPVEEQNDKNPALEDAVLKTVAAFLNTSGGTLLIGVKDKPRDSGDKIAEVLGIEPDYRWLKKGKQDTEGYEHVLIEIFKKSLSNPSSSQYIEISFPVYEGRAICRIDVEPLPRKVGQQCFATTKTMGGKKLFVRSGDSTIPQSRETEYDYIRHHFEGFSGQNN